MNTATAGNKVKYIFNAKNCIKIPRHPIAYWVSDTVIGSFISAPSMLKIAQPKQGLATTDNDRFIRFWYEIVFSYIGFSMDSEQAVQSKLKWFPINKGGEFRKWYGNNIFVVNYQYDGCEIKANVLKKYTYLKTPDFVVKNQPFYFKENGTWSAISSGSISIRYSPQGFIISNAGMAIYSSDLLFYIIAFMNSKCVSNVLLGVINQTINFNAGDLENLPLIIMEVKKNQVELICKDNINISKEDWDHFETSWDFKKHPLV